MNAMPAPESARARISRDLRELIHSGELAPGEQVPSERDLAEKYSVARMTARRAVDQLRTEGLVESVADRRGTVVRTHNPLVTYLNLAERGARMDNPSMALDDWEANVRAQRREPNQVVTVHLDEPAGRNVARWLAVEPGAPVVRRHRYREVDGDPSQLVDSWFPEDIASTVLPGTDRMPLREPGNVVLPGGILAALGHRQVRIERVDSARNADPDTADALSIPHGGALLVSRWIGYRADGRAVRVMLITAAGDRNEFADVVDLSASA
jgi:DNA-binding GntR family transcriptional regulator